MFGFLAVLGMMISTLMSPAVTIIDMAVVENRDKGLSAREASNVLGNYPRFDQPPLEWSNLNVSA
jgi:hypothetical protein